MTRTFQAYDIFQVLVKELLLNEYPCGLGNWREDFEIIQDALKIQKSKKLHLLNPKLTDYKFSVTLKDGDASKDRIDTLSELICSPESPWTSNYTWCDEAKTIRDLSIKEPWKLTPQRLKSQFKTLRIIDKNVSCVDEQITSLSNLETLVLSANYLEMVDSRNLPKSLKSLELCGNFISDLDSLLPNPPYLVHLGLGRNNITTTNDNLNGLHWPCLLSLDLGHNHLTELNSLLETLATLPKLRTLMLQGNPLSLTPGYRGVTVDRLRDLIILDDVRISADERHFCRGFVRRRDLLPSEVQLHVNVGILRNLPLPPEIATPEDFPEFPLIQRKYFVRFWFPTGPEEESSEDDVIFEVDVEGGRTVADSTAISPTKRQKSTSFMSDIPEEGLEADEFAGGFGSLLPVREGDHIKEPAVCMIGNIECSPVMSTLHPYADLSPEGEMEIGWQGEVTRKSLREFRDFCLQPMLVEVMEERNHLYPPNELPQEHEEPMKQKEDKKRDEAKKEDSKPKKKKKVDESQLVLYSQKLNTLAAFQVDVSSLLEGGTTVLEKHLVHSTEGTTTASAEDAKQKDVKDKSNANDKKKVKSAAKKKPAAPLEEETEEAPPPPPLEVTIQLEMVRWRSVKECVLPAMPTA